MTTALVLIVLGVLSRLIPHPPNMVALGAVALFAAARLPERWAFVVPIAILIVSDMAIDLGSDQILFSATRLTIYTSFLAIVALGLLPRKDASPPVRLGMSVLASTLFFVTSNFAVWTNGLLYPRTAEGLAECYVAAIPFYGNTLAADLVGTVVLFGADALAGTVFSRKKAVATGDIDLE